MAPTMLATARPVRPGQSAQQDVASPSQRGKQGKPDTSESKSRPRETQQGNARGCQNDPNKINKTTGADYGNRQRAEELNRDSDTQRNPRK
jgi:hypothetical protein